MYCTATALRALKMTDRVGCIHDKWRELAVVGQLQTYGVCSCAACINIYGDRNPVISVNHVDPICLGQVGSESV